MKIVSIVILILLTAIPLALLASMLVRRMSKKKENKNKQSN